MLDRIAIQCHRWTTGHTDEMALLVPLFAGAPGQPLAIARGRRSAVDVPADRALRVALALGCTSFVLAHSHPDERPPSAADLAVTRRLSMAARVVGLALVAHLVVTPLGWYECGLAATDLQPWDTTQAA